MSDILEQRFRRNVEREFGAIHQRKALDSKQARITGLRVLHTVVEFIQEWANTCTGNNPAAAENTHILPVRFLRDTLSKVVRHVGPGHPRMWKVWSPLLRANATSTSNSICSHSSELRQLILDFLPYTLPPEPPVDTDMQGMLFDYLMQWVDHDVATLPQVLQSLSTLKQNKMIEPKSFFQFCLDMLSKTSDVYLHVVIQTLTENSEGDEDSKLSAEWIRNEIGLFEGTPEATAKLFLPTARVMQRLHERANDHIFLQKYLEQLEESVQEPTDLGSWSVASQDALQDSQSVVHGEEEGRYTVLDLIVLLIHYTHSKNREHVECILDTLFLKDETFAEHLDTFVNMVTMDYSGKGELHNTCFTEWLQSTSLCLLVYLFMLPLRNAQRATLQALQFAKKFGQGLLTYGDNALRKRVISTVIHLNRELGARATRGTQHPQETAIYNKTQQLDGRTSLQETIRNVSCTTFEMMSNVAELIPSILRPYMTTFLEMLLSRETDMLRAQGLSNVISCVIKYSAASKSNGHSEAENSETPFLSIQALMFAHGQEQPSTDPHLVLERRLRGLILVEKLVAEGSVTPALLSVLWAQVKLILVSPTNVLVNPTTGIYCLKVARAMYESKLYQGTAKDIFSTIATVLSASKLVRYSEPENDQEGKSTLGYHNRPNCLTNTDKLGRGKTSRMIFSFRKLCREVSVSEQLKWLDAHRWVFDLLDTYLVLGRRESKSSWAAPRWVEGLFEFPMVDFSILRTSTPKQERTINLVREVVNNFDIESNALSSEPQIGRDFIEILKQNKSRREREEFFESLLQSSFCHCLALAISAAILNHTHTRYCTVLGFKNRVDAQENFEATRLMAFQLAKIYHLLGKCQTMEGIFRSTDGLQRRGRVKKRPRRNYHVSSSCTSTADHAYKTSYQISAGQLTLIVSSFTAGDFVSTGSLWICLADPSHDAVIINSVQFQSPSMEVDGIPIQSDLELVLNFRLKILEHLYQKLISKTPNMENSGDPCELELPMAEELSKIRPFFAQSLRLASHLSLSLPGKQGSERHTKISQLTAAYFRVLMLTLVLCVEGENSDGGKSSENVGYAELSNLYRDILGADEPLTATVVDYKESGNEGDFGSLQKSFLAHLQICEDASIATALVETLSVLAVHSEDRKALTEMAHLNWAFLHSNFSVLNSLSVDVPPFCFSQAIRRIMPKSKFSAKCRSRREIAIQETVLKAAINKSKVHREDALIVQGMVRHWGILALVGEPASLFVDHLHQLHTNLATFLANVDQTRIPTGRTHVLDDIGTDDAEYLPPIAKVQEQKPDLPESNVPGLHSLSFPLYLQLLLDLTVGAAAVFSVSGNDDTIDRKNGPFVQLENLAETFGCLVEIYRTRVHIFPPKILPSVLNSCRSMLNVISFQCALCVEWRSSQRVPTTDQLKAESFDPSSVHYLQEMLDNLEYHVLNNVSLLCDSVDLHTTTGHDSSGRLFGPTQKQKVNAVRVKTRSISVELENYAIAHTLPRDGVSAASRKENRILRRKRQTIEITGLVQYSKGDSKRAWETPLHARKIVGDKAGGTTVRSKIVSSEPSWDNSEESRSSDSSFGVSGDWCQASGNDEEELGLKL